MSFDCTCLYQQKRKALFVDCAKRMAYVHKLFNEIAVPFAVINLKSLDKMRGQVYNIT